MKIGLLPENIGEDAIREIADGCAQINATFKYFRSCAEVLRFLNQKENSLDCLLVGLKVPWVSVDELRQGGDEFTVISRGQEPPWFFLLYEEIQKRKRSLKIHVLSLSADMYEDRLKPLDCGVSLLGGYNSEESMRSIPSQVIN